MPDPKKALLIGINTYAAPTLPSLSACVHDVDAMKESLHRHKDGSDEINYECTTLRDAAPDGSRLTRGQLRRAIVRHFDDFTGDSLLYFSGHGVIRSAGAFLAAYDSTPDDPGVPMNEVLAYATKCPAREVVIVLDCCHAGDFGNLALLGRTDFGDSLSIVREEMTVMAAAGSAQQAVEIGGRSEFTAALVDALDGGAADTLGQVTAPAMYAYARRRFGPATQRPVYKSHATDVRVLRRCLPALPIADILEIPRLFPTVDHRKGLTPEHEPDDEHGNRKEPVDLVKVAEAQLLKRLRNAGLVRSTGGEDFYWTGRRSLTVQLTERGVEFWVRVTKGRI